MTWPDIWRLAFSLLMFSLGAVMVVEGLWMLRGRP